MFAIKVFFLRSYMFVFKQVVRIMPFKWPKLFEGKDSSLELCEHIAKEGHTNVLVVTDAMLVKLGLLEPMLETLKNAGVKTAVYDGVQPDPSIEQIEAGLAILKENDCHAILAVGGGSPIDAAKAIGARAKNNRPVQKMAGLFKIWRGMLPLYAVPTTAGTGSEVTIAAVVSDRAAKKKFAMMDLRLMPTAAALDSALMAGLPAPITAATGMDALTHAVEAYISRAALKRTDKLAIEATQLILTNLETAVSDGGNLDARQAMTKASNLAGMAFTQAGVGYVHAIAHNFGALYHTPHGLANAIVMPYILDFSKPKCAHRLAELARACDVGPAGGDDEALATAFIARIREMNDKFGIPNKLDALMQKDIPAIATAALKEARFTYAVPKYMDQRTCEGIVTQILAS